MKLKVLDSKKYGLSNAWLQNWVTQCWKQLQKKRAIRTKYKKTKFLVLAFVDRRSGRELNRVFRKKDYATDILSFESFEEKSLGELVICGPVAKNQAKDHELAFRDEVAYLVLHGMLHLIGYDHSDRRARANQKMYRLQDSIFAQLNQSSKR